MSKVSRNLLAVWEFWGDSWPALRTENHICSKGEKPAGPGDAFILKTHKEKQKTEPHASSRTREQGPVSCLTVQVWAEEGQQSRGRETKWPALWYPWVVFSWLCWASISFPSRQLWIYIYIYTVIGLIRKTWAQLLWIRNSTHECANPSVLLCPEQPSGLLDEPLS